MSDLQITAIITQVIYQAVEQAFESDRSTLAITVQPCYLKYDAHYTCNVAFALADRVHKNALAIAAVLQPLIQAQSKDKLTTLIGGSGSLNFVLMDIWFAECLASLGQWQPTEIATNNFSGEFRGYTHVQYCYARCCALLRLAGREKMIADLQDFPNEFYDRLHQKLLLTKISEQVLALHLLAIADQLQGSPNLSQGDRLRLIRPLMAQFEVFLAECRMFGVKPEIAKARFGLVAIAQKLIRLLVGNAIELHQEL